jgi:4-hydroxybenzoyl-CoA thioesterase
MPPFTHTLPVRFGDVDHAGIVYYPRFFDYFHAAFEALFRERMGTRSYVDLLDQRRLGLPAVKSECDFRAPLRFGDFVRVELTVSRLGTRSIHFHYRLFRLADERPPAPGDEPAAEGRVVCVMTDLDRFASVDIPEDLRSLMLEVAEESE